MADNPDPGTPPGNPDPAPAFSWKASLGTDLANAPTIQKFQDTKEGLVEAVKSHLSLEKMLGNEKVPIPKSKDDPARAIFLKALGVPDKPEGYALPDAEVPESMKGLIFDKAKFQQVVHQLDLTPAAAKGLWEQYTAINKQAYADAVKAQQEKLTASINALRNEWGDAYQSKVDLGQMVINKFSESKEANDFITATLLQDPNGVKFLAKLGEQFAENKIGDFKYQRHALTAEEAEGEIAAIRKDPKHPYNDPQASPAERERAIDKVNSLIAVVQKTRR